MSQMQAPVGEGTPHHTVLAVRTMIEPVYWTAATGGAIIIRYS
jgi:hypothetical protein